MSLSNLNGGIEINNLTLEFTPGVPVLQDISLSVASGEFVSLVGPSGCGKTTLLNLMAGLVKAPPQGKLDFGALSVLGSKPTLGNPNVAYMLARDSLLPWCSARENAMFGMRVRNVPLAERQAKAQEFLEGVGLKGYEDALPKALSHGMRQRVALARTFSMDSHVLLMDEPFGALDAQTKLHLQDLLLVLTQKHKRTVVFVTHDLAEAVTVSDRVIVMSARPGKIIADVRIDLPRPRSVRELQKDKAYHEAYARVWSMLESGWSQDEH